MPGFSTYAECLEALDRVHEATQRLPVGGAQDLSNVVGAHAAFAGAIRSTPTVAPEDAAGTVRYREVHGLPPLTEESE
jgi:hypothetical protein